MEQLSRRSFLGGAITATAVAVMPWPRRLFSRAPIIRGDGVHDDTAGLQAAIDGEPFRVVGEGVFVVKRGAGLHFSGGGTFKLSRPLRFGNFARVTGGKFDGSSIKEGAVLYFDNGIAPLTLKDVHVIGNSKITGVQIG